ncbi:related to mannose-6-phosphate isomerase [Ramularia collo-cygni]|uniref:Related to mannose-6-phosphate isomerase n=1 Tax=Ramularia collo-cygni TaxID=112498 RepID=A0A2D3VLC8_9PEZI|nr:related to mannose-6-phosphate isomerase [Ramularia collo-cygni]CZT24379.1 related to mannose-6-phosphate isomerase [Ramularia collo-cygni]
MLLSSVQEVKKIYSALTSLPETAFGEEGKHIQELCPRLAEQYDDSDPGILVALITMNYLVLEAGESLYIPADGIHAYLAGDIIECMARSNNVLNTGFCPRADRNNIELFISCLTFTPHSAGESMLRPKTYPRSLKGKSILYAPPLSEFDMLQTSLEAGEKEILKGFEGPAVFVATKGNAALKANGKVYNVREGSVFFVAHGTELELESLEGGFLMHTAFVEGGTE